MGNFSTIPVQPLEQPAVDDQQLHHPGLFAQAAQPLAQMANRMRAIQRHQHHQMLAQLMMQPVAIPPRPRARREPILPRFRMLSLINDLTCVGIPDEIANFEVCDLV